MAEKPTYEELEKRLKDLQEEAVEHRRSEGWLPRLNQFKEELLRPAGIIEKLSRITDGVVDIFDADFCRIWITRPGDVCDSGCFHATVTQGPHVCRYRDRCLHLVASSGRYTHTDGGHGRVPFGCYKIGRVASGRDAKFVTNDVTHDPRVHDHEWAKRLGLVSFAGYRLLSADGTPIGVLALFSRHAILSDEDLLLEGVANSAAQVIQTANTEAALRESERKYSSLVENSLTGIYIDDQDGRIVFANKRFAEIYGYAVDELEGMESWRLVHPEDRRMTAEIRAKRIRGDEVPSEYEARGVTKDGESIWIKRRNTRIQYEGKPAILGNIADISEAKRLESQFQQAQKMKAVGTLAGGIAHDFNNLLMGIQGRISLMLMDTGPDHPQFAHLCGLEEMIKRGADLSKQLLGFARGGKYEVRTTDLNPLVRKSSEMFGRTKKEIRIHTECQRDLWPVEVDRGQMEQVLVNLYVNAWQAMPEGGDLYLRTKNVTLGREYNGPHGVGPGDYVELSVSDTGAGMDEETRQRVFEPFFTTREIGGGTGLGLASVYGIIKNHGGVIRLYSELGHGTTFVIYLPASEKELVERKEPSEAVLGGTEAVILVDDEDMILEVGKGMLTTLGYKVMVARSGKQAIDLYREYENTTDIVILDMIMPDIGGREVYDRLKMINPKVRVLLSSGYSVDGQASEILQRGCDGFIQKPFNVKELSSKLRQILDRQ